MKKLQLDYLDLYLIHWTVPNYDFANGTMLSKIPMQTIWKNMEDMVDQGLIRSLGVSNCQFTMLIDILTYAKHKPVTNQIEVHPYFA